MNDILEPIEGGAALPVIPVLTVPTDGHLPALFAALADSGVRVVELTLRGPDALDVLREGVRAAGEDLTVGAGTVCNLAQLASARAAGAAFAVSPGFDPGLTRSARLANMPYLPGVATASEVMAARELGVRLLKFFPAEAMGGVRALAAMRGPFPDVRFVPTGGVGGDNVAAYLAEPSVACVGGSWLVTADELAAGRFEAVAGRAAAIARLRTAT